MAIVFVGSVCCLDVTDGCVLCLPSVHVVDVVLLWQHAMHTTWPLFGGHNTSDAAVTFQNIG